MEDYKVNIDRLYDSVIIPIADYENLPSYKKSPEDYKIQYAHTLKDLGRQFEIELGSLEKKYPGEGHRIRYYMMLKVDSYMAKYSPKDQKP